MMSISSGPQSQCQPWLVYQWYYTFHDTRFGLIALKVAESILLYGQTSNIRCTSVGNKIVDKQRVLMHGHQRWNVRHGLCHIYMIYVYIWVVYSFCYTPAQRSWRGGILDSPCPSVCPSVRPSVCPSVCRRHGFRSISQVCFGISISNFICMLMVAIGRSLLIFSDVTFKMSAWRPYWFFWFPDSNLTLALNINFKLQRHNTYVYG